MRPRRPLMNARLPALLLAAWTWLTPVQAQPGGIQASPPGAVPAREAASDAARPASSWGTGFVVAPGYLITAHHVIQQRTQLRVGPIALAGDPRPRWLAAELVKADAALDVALLRIPETLPAMRLHPEPTVPLGLEVYVIGYPQPHIQGASRKITAGIVNGYRNESISRPDSGLLQVSAEISQGNSGGPVIAADGTVIGMVQRKINTAKVAERTQDLLVNVNYALRSSQLVEFLQSAGIGVQVQSVNLAQVLRPYEVFAMHQQSVLAVLGRAARAEPAAAAP